MFDGSVLASLSALISFIAIGMSLFALARAHSTESRLKEEITANRARVGRLIQELNVLHEEKRQIDEKQNMELGLD